MGKTRTKNWKERRENPLGNKEIWESREMSEVVFKKQRFLQHFPQVIPIDKDGINIKINMENYQLSDEFYYNFYQQRNTI